MTNEAKRFCRFPLFLLWISCQLCLDEVKSSSFIASWTPSLSCCLLFFHSHFFSVSFAFLLETVFVAFVFVSAKTKLGLLDPKLYFAQVLVYGFIYIWKLIPVISLMSNVALETGRITATKVTIFFKTTEELYRYYVNIYCCLILLRNL